MTALALGFLLVPVLDQALKGVVLRRLAPAAVSLGPLGTLQAVRSRIWLARGGWRPRLATVWALWFVATGSLVTLTGLSPPCGWFAGALVGGSLSHALETSLRGCVIDYVRLRFGPAFNLADVAITVGALGVLVQLAVMMMEARA
jgi:hypothetical protein